MICSSFFFNDTATTEIYTLSLHDALPISPMPHGFSGLAVPVEKIYPCLVPFLELEDGRTIAAVDGADEIKPAARSEEHTSELQSPDHLVCRLLLEKKKTDAAHALHSTSLH